MEPDPLLQERYNNEILKATYDSVRTWESELISYTGGNWSFDIWEYKSFLILGTCKRIEKNFLVQNFEKIKNNFKSLKKSS